MGRIIVFCCLFFAVSLEAQSYIIPDLQRDDFKTKKSWFSVNISPPFSTKHSIDFLNGYLKANLNDPSGDGVLQWHTIGMENIGISTANLAPIYGKQHAMEVTIRIKTLNPLPEGSRGWGFWRSEGIPVKTNQAVWFMEQKSDDYADENWWLARTTDGVDDTYSFLHDVSAYDNQAWHTYKVRRSSGSTETGYYQHFIDGNLVLSKTPADFPDGTFINEDYTFNCWNDNLVYDFVEGGALPDCVTVYYNSWIGSSSFIVDFVEITKNGYDPSYSVSPVGILKLREYESEMDDGINDGLWKDYSFNSDGGRCVIIATALAEEYDGYDDDDDLKMVVDSVDYGYNGSKSWNGDVDQSQPKTIVIDTSVVSGSHTLQFHSRVTPLLVDATVLSSPDGGLVLDQTVNSSAPEGSADLEWLSYNFSCDAGSVAVYISASADEEPGWNHQIASIDSTNDDELRIELDGADYGWGTDKAWEGNSLYGHVKTVLLTENLDAGLHTLKLFANESPTVYRVVVFAENMDNPSSVGETIIPEEFKLHQNYPNPFNPETTIKFVTGKYGQVQLDIFDIKGRSVKTVTTGERPAGTHTLVWDGRDSAGNNAASGVYFYRLKANGQQQIRKMTLLR